ncbi:unnamed protein product [Leptosia nina]|uniref:Uncharacterized protein n=1 Tax=Leptosia nina TaxID=320188 RepID=A0AAV1IXA0_9NEOP
MRGSTAGLTDTLAGGSHAHATLLEFADQVFGSAVVAPAVVAYWKATWSLMDIYLIPQHPVYSAIAALVFGLGLNWLLCVLQTPLAKFINLDKGRFTFYVLTRLYTCVAGIGCVGAWRGVWNLLNECTGDGAQTVLSTTAAATLSLAALRTLRNIIAAPFAVVIDSPKDFFDVPTMFRTVSICSLVCLLFSSFFSLFNCL